MNRLEVQQELEKEGFGFIFRNKYLENYIYTYKWVGKEFT